MSPDEENQPFLDKAYGDDIHATPSHLPELPVLSQLWKRRPVVLWTPLSSGLVAFTLTSLFWGLLFLRLFTNSHSVPETIKLPNVASHSHEKPSPADSNFTLHASCGKTSEESRRLGCKYDILSNHWVPAACMDDAAVAVYQQDDGPSWIGYLDKARTQSIGSPEAMGDVAVYHTNMRDHIVHCAALWKKQFRAFYEDRTYYDSLLLDPMHTNHCADFLVHMTDKGGVDFRAITIEVEVGYAKCWARERACTQ